MQEEIIKTAKALCEKFINKVETGRARSRETYAECKALLKMINKNEHPQNIAEDTCKHSWVFMASEDGGFCECRKCGLTTGFLT